MERVARYLGLAPALALATLACRPQKGAPDGGPGPDSGAGPDLGVADHRAADEGTAERADVGRGDAGQPKGDASSNQDDGVPPSEGIGLYKTFERSIENTKNYANKFTSVDLRASFTSPSGTRTDFMGFFDGDGIGGGNQTTGTIWKIRFMPNELGVWRYQWTWSDGTPGGTGEFSCVTTGAGKGILRAYANNPRWFAYNGTEPVWLKSYYESSQRGFAQPLDWMVTNVYQVLLDSGYNHFQTNWLFPLCCESEYYTDGLAQSIGSRTIYQSGKASTTMQLDIWKQMEDHLRWLNDRNVGLHMFLGFDGGQNNGPAWDALSAAEQDFYVRYLVSRLGPYANIAGWNFTWEVPGNREAYELGWARLVQKYDVFNHLRTYEDETPGTNEYGRPEYSFAAIENHLMFSTDSTLDRPFWTSAWTHHNASLAGYVTGKPTFMTEGNALWRRYWAAKLGQTPDNVRQAAWGCATAAGSFTWCGHTSTPLTARGATGLPFFGDDNTYRAAAKAIDILGRVMTEELVFHRMTPQDGLLSGHDNRSVWCLAEPQHQYLVFSAGGKPFSLSLASGSYTRNQWIDAKTDAATPLATIDLAAQKSVAFTPPNTSTDWVLLVREP